MQFRKHHVAKITMMTGSLTLESNIRNRPDKYILFMTECPTTTDPWTDDDPWADDNPLTAHQHQADEHEYEVHPFAAKFPLLEDDELDRLAADIASHGLHRPIALTSDGRTLVDGRNRLAACKRSGCDPVFVRLPEHYTETMILDYIVSANLARRHLSAGQRAMLALDYEQFYAGAAGAQERERKSALDWRQGSDQDEATVADLRQSSERERKSAEKAAKVTGASGRGVSQAKAVERDTPDLAEKVRTGEMSLDAADKERKRRHKASEESDVLPHPWAGTPGTDLCLPDDDDVVEGEIVPDDALPDDVLSPNDPHAEQTQAAIAHTFAKMSVLIQNKLMHQEVSPSVASKNFFEQVAELQQKGWT